jgi:hypothetical protein
VTIFSFFKACKHPPQRSPESGVFADRVLNIVAGIIFGEYLNGKSKEQFQGQFRVCRGRVNALQRMMIIWGQISNLSPNFQAAHFQTTILSLN